MPVLWRSWCALRAVLCLSAVGLALSAGCTPKPLPEEGSPSARLYAEKCGSCHPAYQPVALKPKMWETMVARMEVEMSRRGITISPADRAEILAYLSRNAGTM